MSGLLIALTIVGFPLWFPLMIAAGAILFSFFIVIVSLIFSFFVVVFSFAVTGIAGMVLSVVIALQNPAAGVFTAGASLILMALSILLFFPALMATNGIIHLVRSLINSLKRLFVKKGRPTRPPENLD